MKTYDSHFFVFVQSTLGESFKKGVLTFRFN